MSAKVKSIEGQVFFFCLCTFGIGAGVGMGIDWRIYRFVSSFRTSCLGYDISGLAWHGTGGEGGGELKHLLAERRTLSQMGSNKECIRYRTEGCLSVVVTDEVEVVVDSLVTANLGYVPDT